MAITLGKLQDIADAVKVTMQLMARWGIVSEDVVQKFNSATLRGQASYDDLSRVIREANNMMAPLIRKFVLSTYVIVENSATAKAIYFSAAYNFENVSSPGELAFAFKSCCVARDVAATQLLIKGIGKPYMNKFMLPTGTQATLLRVIEGDMAPDLRVSLAHDLHQYMLRTVAELKQAWLEKEKVLAEETANAASVLLQAQQAHEERVRSWERRHHDNPVTFPANTRPVFVSPT